MSKIQQNKSSSIKIVALATAFITISILIVNIILSSFNLEPLLENNTHRGATMFLLLIVQSILIIAPVYYYYKAQNVDLSLNKGKLSTIMGSALIGFITFFIVNVAISYISTELNLQIPGYGEQDARLGLFGYGPYNMIFAGLALIIIAPIAEELLFRGLMLNQLKQKLNSKTAIIISAAIFAGFHLEFQIFIPLFIIGIILGAVQEKTGTIYAAIALHMINNSLAFIVEIFETTF